MQTIFNYISRGKGIGALFILGLAVIIAAYISIITRTLAIEAIPHIQLAADAVLPIKVQDGKVVVPENTVKEIRLSPDDSDFKMIIDTTRDQLNPAELETGAYLSRSFFYLIDKSQNEIRTLELSGSYDLPKADYQPAMRAQVKWVVAATFAAGTIILFFAYFITTIFYAFCAGLAGIINKKNLNFDAKMRLSTLLFIAVYIFSTLLEKISINLPLLLFFLIMIALQIIVVRKLPE